MKMNVANSVYICIVLAIVHCDTTTKSNNTTKTVSKNSTVSGVAKTNFSDGKPINLRTQIDEPPGSNTTFKNITTKSKHLVKHRRSILIVNASVLRNGGGKEISKTAETLLYQEYNDDGSIQLSYEMKNLNDVAKFFELYLDTKICHGHCE